MPAKTIKTIPVLITTKHRGVFFGRIDPAKRHDLHIDMTGVRNALYWAAGGFFSLAVTGPDTQCRVGVKLEGTFTARDVTSVSDCSPAAVTAWEDAPCYSSQ